MIEETWGIDFSVIRGIGKPGKPQGMAKRVSFLAPGPEDAAHTPHTGPETWPGVGPMLYYGPGNVARSDVDVDWRTGAIPQLVVGHNWRERQ